MRAVRTRNNGNCFINNRRVIVQIGERGNFTVVQIGERGKQSAQSI